MEIHRKNLSSKACSQGAGGTGDSDHAAEAQGRNMLLFWGELIFNIL